MMYRKDVMLRITPACAGKRECNHQRQNGAKDHPRVCGEKNALRLPLPDVGGSPPRVRGKVFLPRSFCALGGITPACAGKRMFCRLDREPERDHPRVCGEKAATFRAV